MISTRRPEAPTAFVREGAALRDAFNDELPGRLTGVPRGDERIAAFFERRELWADARFKPSFARSEVPSKCGYCERFRDLEGELHVDHYRPKAAVFAWETTPTEVLDSPPPTRREHLGYWWRAWSWPNLVLACWTCNARWKRNLFPTDAREGRALLLNPYEPFATRAHFAWDVTGHVTGRSTEGAATIRVCGLNRSRLVSARRGVYRNTLDATCALIEAHRHGTFQERDRCEQHLRRLGGRDREFTGMVRWVIEEHLGVAPEDFFDDP